jgi:hypothetical protein
MAKPWERDPTCFKHPHLIEWVSENRGAILAAILTIVKAWVVAGMPAAQGLPNLGGFESYCRIIGGVLSYMGVNGFLANLDAMYDEMDTETPQWEGFLETWHDILSDRAVTAAALISHLNDNAELRAALPDAIADMSIKNYARRLGNALAKKKGMRFPNGYSLIKPGKGEAGATWLVTDSGLTLKKESLQAKLALTADSPDSSLTPALRKNKSEDNNVYGGGVGTRVRESGLASKRLTPGGDIWAGMPDYPTTPCPTCKGIDWWPDFKGKRFVCSRCHPKSESKDNAE